jgi:hypothetical protein
MFQVPILRSGRPYQSKDRLELRDYATGEPVAQVSQANPGLIARDLRADDWASLQERRGEEILSQLTEAARHFMHSELPCGPSTQSPEQFVAAQSATTGLPYALCLANMRKIEGALVGMRQILEGLTGGLDLEVLDSGCGWRDGHVVSFAPKARRFGAVLPANSPGVHALWLPAVALKMPLALKPGQQEPWTPLRILESLRAAGVPAESLGFYPAGHDGAGVILRRSDAAMLFGAGATVRPWLGHPNIEIHGPGYSKLLLGPDVASQWRDYLDLVATSVACNGGRSCINASAVRTAAHGRDLALALAERLSAIEPRSRDDDSAQLAAFPDAKVAQGIDAAIDRQLREGGAEDISAGFRPNRLVWFEGAPYLLPTVIYTDAPDHPLANQEYLFPYVSVTDVPGVGISSGRAFVSAASLGPSLVVTALTNEPAIERELMSRPDIGRLNLGPVPTTVVQWDQPHEGNLFDRLYQQRAFQRAPLVSVG